MLGVELVTNDFGQLIHIKHHKTGDYELDTWQKEGQNATDCGHDVEYRVVVDRVDSLCEVEVNLQIYLVLARFVDDRYQFVAVNVC